jgi:hypothetical protein
VSEVPGGDASFSGPPVLTAPGQRESLERRSVFAMRDGMTALAEDTGGMLVTNSNDLSAGLGRVLRDSRSYYVLAYEAANPKRDGEFRKIGSRARAKGCGSTPRGSRPGREEAGSGSEGGGKRPPAARHDRDLGRALAALYPLNGIPCGWSWTTWTFLPPGRRSWSRPTWT